MHKEPDSQEKLTLARAVVRGLRLTGHICVGFGVLFALAFVKQPGRLAGWWYRRFLRIMGVEIETSGAWPSGGCLVAANHVSWLDIIVFGALLDAAFVSKAEIGQWPVVGRFARHTGTVFLPRGAGRTREATQRLVEALDAQRAVILFPEATTNNALLPERFYPRLFAASVEAQAPVQPVALHYLPESGEASHHPLAPWVNASLPAHFRRLFRLPRLRVRVTFCPEVTTAGCERRYLSEVSRQAVANALTGEQATQPADREPAESG